MAISTLDLTVRAITREATFINSYELVDPNGRNLPPFTAGSHIDVHLSGGLVRQYSLCNDPRERHRYVIAVLKNPSGAGGSRTLHETVRAGSRLTVSVPRNHFALDPAAEHHLLLAGGIGITPMMAMVQQLEADGANFTLHYCTRGPEQTAFRERLRHFGGRVIHHFDSGDPAKSLDVVGLLRHQSKGTHLYYCGPTGLMDAARRGSAHWEPGTVHFEYFAPAPESLVGLDGATGEEGQFHVRIASTGATYAVSADKSIVEVLREHGVDIDTSCEAGTCGTCKTRYLEGEPVHMDYVLTDSEQAEWVMICCARSRSSMLVLDL